MGRQPQYASYWNESERVSSFMEARRMTPFELWLVLEHLPYRMPEWVRDHPWAAGDVVDELVGTIHFLHRHGVFHFDAHHGNVVTDGRTVFLTDFGLASDRAFDLSIAEHTFLDRHRHYDLGETIYSVGSLLLHLFSVMAGEERDSLLQRFCLRDALDQASVIDVLVSNVEALTSDGLLGISPTYGTVVARYRPVILFMNDFFSTLHANRRKNTFFDDVRLGELLTDTGIDIA